MQESIGIAIRYAWSRGPEEGKRAQHTLFCDRKVPCAVALGAARQSSEIVHQEGDDDPTMAATQPKGPQPTPPAAGDEADDGTPDDRYQEEHPCNRVGQRQRIVRPPGLR